MGYKKSWDVSSITSQIHSIARECSSPYNDGYTAFGCKQDLYQLKELLDNVIRNSPTFSGEQEWLQEQEKKRIIKILKE
jgi:diphthamide biosynthesis methyltransferase